MKTQSGLKILVTAAGFLLPLKMLTAAFSRPNGSTTRIWVQYSHGKKEKVRQILDCAGAVYHYDFGDLDSFVVTIPERNVKNLGRYPDIMDYWYTAMLTQDDPFVRHLP